MPVNVSKTNVVFCLSLSPQQTICLKYLEERRRRIFFSCHRSQVTLKFIYSHCRTRVESNVFLLIPFGFAHFVSSVILLYYISRTLPRFAKNAQEQRKRKRNAARKKTSIEELDGNSPKIRTVDLKILLIQKWWQEKILKFPLESIYNNFRSKIAQ